MKPKPKSSGSLKTISSIKSAYSSEQDVAKTLSLEFISYSAMDNKPDKGTHLSGHLRSKSTFKSKPGSSLGSNLGSSLESRLKSMPNPAELSIKLPSASIDKQGLKKTLKESKIIPVEAPTQNLNASAKSKSTHSPTKHLIAIHVNQKYNWCQKRLGALSFTAIICLFRLHDIISQQSQPAVYIFFVHVFLVLTLVFFPNTVGLELCFWFMTILFIWNLISFMIDVFVYVTKQYERNMMIEFVQRYPFRYFLRRFFQVYLYFGVVFCLGIYLDLLVEPWFKTKASKDEESQQLDNFHADIHWPILAPLGMGSEIEDFFTGEKKSVPSTASPAFKFPSTVSESPTEASSPVSTPSPKTSPFPSIASTLSDSSSTKSPSISSKKSRPSLISSSSKTFIGKKKILSFASPKTKINKIQKTASSTLAKSSQMSKSVENTVKKQPKS